MELQVAEMIGASARSRAEVSRRAGVHRSTVYRMLEGSTDIRLETLQEIAYACGFEIEMSFRPTSDPAAADAGRLLLDGTLQGVADVSAEIAAWMDRLQRFSGDEPIEVAAESGVAASLLHRDGAIGMRGEFSVDRLASAGHAMGTAWALSGTFALEALGGEHDDQPTNVLWVQDPIHAFQLLADTGTRESQLARAELIICAPGELTLEGRTDLDGIQFVAPTQAIIDSMGLKPAQRVAARHIAQGW